MYHLQNIAVSYFGLLLVSYFYMKMLSCCSLAAFPFSLKDSTISQGLMVVDSVCYYFFLKKIHNLYFWIIVLLTFRADFFFVTLISLITPCRSLVACRSLLRTQSSPILEVPHVFFASLIILISGSLMIAMRYEIMIIWDKFLLCCMTFLDLIMVILHQV